MFGPARRVGERGAAWRLAGLGVLLGVAYLPATLEISVTLSHHGAFVRTLLLLLYPMALAATGLGALLLGRAPALAGPSALRGAGLSLLAYAGAALFVNFLTSGTAALLGAAVLHVATLSGFYLLMGAAVAGAYAEAHAEGRGGLAWAAHLGGLLVGYLASDPAVQVVGVNALLVAIGAALLLVPRVALVGVVLASALAVGVGLDGRIEACRDLGGLAGEGAGVRVRRNVAGAQMARVAAALAEPLWMGWSRYGQTTVVPTGPEGRDTLVAYNLQRQFIVRADDVVVDDDAPGAHERSGLDWDVRRAMYAAFRPTDRLMFVGTGAGRGLRHLTFPLHPGITAVERNPQTVRFFRDVRPDLNGGVYQAVTVQAADGRGAIERATGPFDALSFEAAQLQPDHALLPATAPFSLVTREALDTYLMRLAPEGLLLMEFARAGETSRRDFIPSQVHAWLAGAGLAFARVTTGDLGSVVYLACRTDACLDAWLARMELDTCDDATVERAPPADEPLVLTDDRPFASWFALGARSQRLLLVLAGILLVGAATAALGIGERVRHPRGAAWFFGLGVAHTGLQAHAFYAWRAYFGDEIGTILRLIALFLLAGALGSASVRRVPSRWLAGWRLGLGVAGLLALHALALRGLPFLQPDGVARALYGALAPLPAGVLMGALFPVGMRGATPAGVRVHLAADALGTLAGAAAVYLIALPLGLGALGAVSAAVYVGIGAARRP